MPFETLAGLRNQANPPSNFEQNGKKLEIKTMVRFQGNEVIGTSAWGLLQHCTDRPQCGQRTTVLKRPTIKDQVPIFGGRNGALGTSSLERQA